MCWYHANRTHNTTVSKFPQMPKHAVYCSTTNTSSRKVNDLLVCLKFAQCPPAYIWYIYYNWLTINQVQLFEKISGKCATGSQQFSWQTCFTNKYKLRITRCTGYSHVQNRSDTYNDESVIQWNSWTWSNQQNFTVRMSTRNYQKVSAKRKDKETRIVANIHNIRP